MHRLSSTVTADVTRQPRMLAVPASSVLCLRLLGLGLRDEARRSAPFAALVTLFRIAPHPLPLLPPLPTDMRQCCHKQKCGYYQNVAFTA